LSVSKPTSTTKGVKARLATFAADGGRPNREAYEHPLRSDHFRVAGSEGGIREPDLKLPIETKHRRFHLALECDAGFA
jgi:hypothetical protein